VTDPSQRSIWHDIFHLSSPRKWVYTCPSEARTNNTGISIIQKLNETIQQARENITWENTIIQLDQSTSGDWMSYLTPNVTAIVLAIKTFRLGKFFGRRATLVTNAVNRTYFHMITPYLVETAAQLTTEMLTNLTGVTDQTTISTLYRRYPNISILDNITTSTTPIAMLENNDYEEIFALKERINRNDPKSNWYGLGMWDLQNKTIN
jgi:hypothetical protein